MYNIYYYYYYYYCYYYYWHNQQPLNEVNVEKDSLTWRRNADNIKEKEKYVECIFRISVLV